MGMDSFPKLVFFFLVGAAIAYPISGAMGFIAVAIALWCIAIFFGGASGGSGGGTAGHHGHRGHCRHRCRRR